MADHYLLESGAPDGYQLEDGSGVLLLEEGVVSPIQLRMLMGVGLSLFFILLSQFG